MLAAGEELASPDSSGRRIGSIGSAWTMPGLRAVPRKSSASGGRSRDAEQGRQPFSDTRLPRTDQDSSRARPWTNCSGFGDRRRLGASRRPAKKQRLIEMPDRMRVRSGGSMTIERRHADRGATANAAKVMRGPFGGTNLEN